MSHRWLVPVCALVVAFVGACGEAGQDPGPETSLTRDVASFSSVRADGALRVVVRQGDRRPLQLRGGEHALEELETTVKDAELRLNLPGSWKMDASDLVVTVTAPGLASATVEDASELELADADLPAFALTVGGAGDASGRGRVDRLNVTVTGAGDADLSELVAGSATVDVSGAGDVRLAVERELSVRITGAGDVTYRGDPVVSQDVTGAGELNRDP